ncbi:mercury resistance system periplasmic binding protein MerP [Rhodoferax ferrireducens]|uniref:mercury resistance system periplasmic binding protein MerP n=1 Tax=Rhodoferax ferrireducens TaxID=192843 RepID=UPI000E0DA8A6|nr:mercury resistance system periplasmic binding protein MerP [Rhodoferax ferrireducens]
MNKLIVFMLGTLLTIQAWAASQTGTLSAPTMNCALCPITVKKALTKVSGVRQTEVNFDKHLPTVTFDDSRTSVDALTQATEDAGYPSTLKEDV